MKFKRSRILSTLLAGMLALALVPVPAFAEITPQTDDTSGTDPALDAPVTAEDDAVVTDETGGIPGDSTESAEDVELSVDDTDDAAEPASDITDDEAELGVQDVHTVIDYVYIEEVNQIVGTPENIAVGFLDTGFVVDSATLVYADEVGEEHEVEMNAVVEGAVAFVLDENPGTYELLSLRYTVGEETFEVAFADEGIDDAVFSVSAGEEGEVETTAFIVEDDGSLTQAASLEEAVEEASIDATGVAAEDTELAIAAEEDGELEPQSTVRIALDPGHDGSHPGAHYGDLKEEELTLKVALYCRDELLTYPGVEVYMTHSTLACPNPGMGSQDDNRARVRAAVAWGADVYISFHMNSYSTATHGYEVYFSSGSRQSSASRELAGYVSTQLSGLGLSAHGSAIKDNDWIACQYTGDYGNIPGILIEHAFIDGDYAWLHEESNLKALGVADATAIANYFHIVKRSTVTGVHVGNVSWLNSGTFRIYITGSISASSTVKLPVWTAANGQDDIKWYTAIRDSNGNYYIDVRLSDHGAKAGDRFYIHCYITDPGYNQQFFSEGCTTYTYSGSIAPSVTANLNAGQTVATASMNPGDASYDGTRVRFAVWSQEGGQDDLVWYDGTRQKDGSFTYNVQTKNHKTGGVAAKEGKYSVHCYAYVGSTPYFIGSTTFEIVKPQATVEVTGINVDAGTYTVTVSNIIGFSGISSVLLPTWTKSDQSDIKWYMAKSNGDGTYSYTVPMSDHGWLAGTYRTHCYIVAGDGTQTFVGNVNQHMDVPPSSVGTVLSADETTANVTAIVPYATSVNVAVWSRNNGQDDIKWYRATKNSSGAWTVSVPVSNHKDSGVYSVHCYASSGGTQTFAGASSFEVTAPSGTVAVTDVNVAKGTYTVTVSDIDCPSGVATVRMPSWTKSDQSDIKWYTATKNSDGSYSFEVPMGDHGWLAGTYRTHVYITGKNGVMACTGGVTQVMEIPPTGVSAELNDAGTQAQITVTVPYASAVTVPVWSVTNGQDDLVWYKATRNADGTWGVTVPLNKHKSVGTFNVHCYATVNGSQTFIGNTSFDVGTPSGTVAITAVDTEKGTYTVTVSDIVAPASITRIQMPSWTKSDQSDIKWYTATKNSDGTYSFTVPMSDHGWLVGTYRTHVYLTDSNGVLTCLGGVTQEMTLPEATVTVVLNPTESTATVTAVVPYNATSVLIPTWSRNKGQDDIKWYKATKQADGSWVVKVPISAHKDTGTYSAHCYATVNGNQFCAGTTSFDISPVTAEISVAAVDEDAGAFRVNVSGIESVAPVNKVQIAVWCASDQSDIHWYTLTRGAEGTYSVMVRAELHNYNSGTYRIHCYVTLDNGVFTLPCSTTQKFTLSDTFFQNINITGDYSIMGASLVSVDSMVAYYNAMTARRGYSFPSYYASHYSTSGVRNINDFCNILYEEAEAEGVRAEVVFCQCMYETNWLQYTGAVSVDKYNFAGLGAVDSDPVNGAYVYSSLRMGLRAQVQHLKAYASPSSLNNPLVPARNAYHSYIADGSRYAVVGSAYGFGCAPTVRALSSKWASSSTYGDAILRFIYELRTY